MFEICKDIKNEELEMRQVFAKVMDDLASEDERVRVFETINGVEFNKFKNNISDETMYTYVLGKDKYVCSEKPNQIIVKYKTDRGISIDERYNLNIDVMNICNQFM